LAISELASQGYTDKYGAVGGRRLRVGRRSPAAIAPRPLPLAAQLTRDLSMTGLIRKRNCLWRIFPLVIREAGDKIG